MGVTGALLELVGGAAVRQSLEVGRVVPDLLPGVRITDDPE